MRNSILNKQFRYSYFNTSLLLAITCAIVFLLTRYIGISINRIPLVYWLSLSPGFIQHGCIWQFVTYMFVHYNLSHLFFNILALLMFGMMLERRIGSKEFLLFYMVSGTLSGVISYLIYRLTGTSAVLMGASGAIYGLLFLFAVMFPDARILLFFFIPMRAPMAVLVFAVMCVFSELFTTSSTANLTHLAGFAVAWLYCLVRFRVNPLDIWRNSSRAR